MEGKHMEYLPIERLIVQARTSNRRTTTHIHSLQELRAELRNRRKAVIGSYIPLSPLLQKEGQLDETAANTLSEYLAQKTGMFWSGANQPSPEFFFRFYNLSVYMVASGNLGNESADDIIQLAECLVRSKEVFITVAKDLFPDDMLSELFEFADQCSDKHLTPVFEDAVLGAISVFLGSLKDPV